MVHNLQDIRGAFESQELYAILVAGQVYAQPLLVPQEEPHRGVAS
jgi:hypothetical protein